MVTNAYNESLSYDKNGNILSLGRNGDTDPQMLPFVIDDLTYGYLNENSNLLVKVEESVAGNDNSGFKDLNKTGDDYSYDANGNMITDKSKHITQIQYNQLNLPKKITFGTTGTIEYIYNSAGQKLRKIVTEGAVETTTDYLRGFQYKDNVLQFFPTAEGYVKNDAGVLSYVFQYKDHLGNVRLSYAKNLTTNVLEIIEENNYYPFGLKHNGYNPPNTSLGNNDAQKYQFLAQERQDELGLNWDTFRYRNYDYAIGRFMGIDPVSEDYTSITTFQFAHNNPVWKIEIEGLEGATTSGEDVVNQEPDVFGKGMLWANDFIFSAAERITGDSGPAYLTTVDPGQAQAQFDHLTSQISSTIDSGKAFLKDPIGSMQAMGEDAVQTIRDLGSGDAKKTANAIITLAPFFIYPETGVETPLAKAEARTVNGNSKASTNLQHGYEITNETQRLRHKVGVSGGKLNKNGTSRRANSQVNKLNKKGGDKFSAKVRIKNIPNRSEILDWEQYEVDIYYKKTNTTPAGQKRPKPTGT